jgi:murein DD-endopeptidase MepM/ murein hydrolase activator NlpD
MIAAVLLSTKATVEADPGEHVMFQPPVSPTCISSPFGWRHAVGPYIPAGFHNGIDLTAPAGAEVRAAASGTIATIRRHGVGGLWVLINHPDGRSTLYAHLGTVWGRIIDGQRRVAAGDPIGHVGYTGLINGTHVFFAVFDHGQAIDPEPLLAITRCDRPTHESAP